LGMDKRRPPELRVAALRTAAPRLGAVTPALFDYLRSQLGPKVPPLLRLAAADALGNLRLDDAQLETLAGALAAAGAMEVPRLVAAFERSRNPAIGKKLVAALGQSPGRNSMSAAALRRTLKDYPPEVLQAAESLLQRLGADTEKQKARLAELEPLLKGGNAKQAAGALVGTRAAAATARA